MKNILLLFLSKINPSTDKEKGTSELRVSKYKFSVDAAEEDTLQTNESAVKYLAQFLPQKKFDAIFAFESKGAKKPIKVLNGDFTKYNGKTSVDILKDRINGLYEEYIPCPYNENNPIASSLNDMTVMSKLITEYKDKHGDVCLHADMTGGMRNASMMMLGIMRFLEYSNIKFGKILYSNYDFVNRTGKVEEAGDVYRFFDLVAGANEFAKFGSSKTLKEYAKDNKESISLKLNSLLNAMDGFSDQIKLCYYYDFTNAVKNLEAEVNNFENSADDNAHDGIFRSMLPTIKSQYQAIFKHKDRDVDDLDYIEWCVDHGYYQQAMTLYVERVPEYIFEKRILCETKKEKHNDYVFRMSKGECVTYRYWSLAQYFRDGDDDEYKIESERKKISLEIMKIFQEIRTNQNYDIKKLINHVNLLEDVSKFDIDWNKEKVISELLTFGMLIKLNEDERRQYFDSNEFGREVIKFFEAENGKVDIYNNSGITKIYKYFENKMESIRPRKLNQKLTDEKGSRLNVLKIRINDSSEVDAYRIFYGIKFLVREGYLDKLTQDEESWKRLRKIVEEYTKIRQDMRNFSNHAHNEKAPFAIKDIEKAIIEGITRLREEVKYVQQ